MPAIFEQYSSLEPKCSTERYDDHNDDDDNNDDDDDDDDDDSHDGYTVEGIHYRHANHNDDDANQGPGTGDRATRDQRSGAIGKDPRPGTRDQVP